MTLLTGITRTGTTIPILMRTHLLVMAWAMAMPCGGILLLTATPVSGIRSHLIIMADRLLCITSTTSTNTRLPEAVDQEPIT